METLFENQYIRDRASIKEFYVHWFFKRPLVVALYMIILLLFALSLVDFIWTGTNSVVLYIVPLVMAFQLISFYRSVDLAVKRDEESNSGMPLEVKTCVTSESLTREHGTLGRNDLPLSKISSVFVTSNLIVLMSDAKMIYMFRKDSFTKGTPEDFISFLKERGILR